MQNTVAQYIATWPSLDLCKKLVQRLWAWVPRRWWDQEVLDLVGTRTEAAAEEEKYVSEGEEEYRYESTGRN